MQSTESGVLAERSLAPAGAPSRRRWRVGSYLLLAPALLLFLAFFVTPLLVVALVSVLTGSPVNDPDVRLTGQHYAKLLSDRYYVDVLLVTLRVGLYTTIASLLVGYPLAYQLARLRSPTLRTLMLMAVLSPLLVGVVVRTYAWMTLLADQGVINSVLRGLGLTRQPVRLMYNEFGIVVALVHIYTPFMVLTLSGVIGKIDPRWEEAARNLGAGKLRAFREVTLPLSLPGVVAGSLLVFALSISAYVTPILMGGFSIITLPILIYQQVSGVFNFGFAGALGLILLVVSLVIVALYQRTMARVARGVGI
ncbi:MAG TPA: ABC transporter permease [Methylomirabilota bacterium]|nr:ABC transporter permease [Methylomirabilota bacterium]